jgi:O-antigen/teichoic acid export membrane protein
VTERLSPSSDTAVGGRKQILRHLSSTAIAQVAALALGALVIPIATRHWDPQEFGRYAVTYRILALLLPALTLSAGVSVARYIAQRGMPEEAVSTAVVSAIFAMAPLLVPACFVGLLLPRQVGQLLFGAPDADTVRAAIVLILGATTYTLVTASLLGQLKFLRCNALSVLYVGVIPLLALALGGSVSTVLLITGLLWVIASVPFLIPILGRTSWVAIERGRRVFFVYGIRRVPGELGAFGLISLPPLLAAHTSNLEYAGFVSLAMSGITIAGSLCAPISTVSLPHISRAFASKDYANVRGFVSIIAVTNVALVGASIGAYFALPELVPAILGHRYAGAIATLQIACLAVPPYGCYVTVRSALDAYYDQAVTMRSAVVGFVAFIAVYLSGRHLGYSHMEMYAAVVGLWFLGALTLYSAVRLMKRLSLGSLSPDIVRSELLIEYHSGDAATLPTAEPRTVPSLWVD